MKTETHNRKNENRGTQDISMTKPEDDLTNKQQKSISMDKMGLLFTLHQSLHIITVQIYKNHENLQQKTSRKDITKLPQTTLYVQQMANLWSTPLHETTSVEDVPLPMKNPAIVIYDLTSLELSCLM